MVYIDELLELKNRNLYLEKDKKKIPMSLNYYVVDDMFFFEIKEDNTTIHDLEELRDLLEKEAYDECWSGDIYTAPMTKISDCEIRFPKNYSEVIQNDIFDNCYTITNIETTMDDIIIHLK